MGLGRAALCAWCLLAHLCHTAAQTAVSHVLVLHDNPSAKADDVIGVLKKLGVSAEQGAALVEEVSSKGSAVIVAGSQESCEQVSKLFDVINVKSEVRPKRESGAPSEPTGSSRPVRPSKSAGSDVEELDAAGFKAAAEGGAPYLVMFHAPWCGHCRAALPELRKAAARLRGGGVHVAAIDCDRAKALAQELGIKGYPTIKFFAGGQAAVDYNGPRTAMALASFAQGRALASKVTGVLGGAVKGAVKGAKLAMSKIAGGARRANGAA